MKGQHRARARSWKIVWGGAALLAATGMLGGCAGIAGMGDGGTVYRPPPAGQEQDQPPLPTRQVMVSDSTGIHPARVLIRPARLPRGAQPARHAWVVVMWRYGGSVSDACMHGVVVRTDAKGEFSAHMWVDPLNVGYGFFPWRGYHSIIVYQPGYAIADSRNGPDAENGADLRFTADNEPVLLLKPYTGGFAGRMNELREYLDNPTLACGTSSLTVPPSPQMAPFLLAITDEADSLARTRAERDSVAALRTRVKVTLGLVRQPPVRPRPMPSQVRAMPMSAAPAMAPAQPVPSSAAPVQMAPAKPAR